MPTAFDVRVLESVVRVQFDDSVEPADRESIRSQWRDVIEEGAEPSVLVAASVGRKRPVMDPAVRVVTASSPERLAALLATEITLAGITALSGRALMLHAGAITLDDGGVIALVGPSGRGKTTATQALGLEQGYVTDETLAVYPGGAVLPYRKPLSIGRHPDAKTQAAASDLGLGDLPDTALRLEAIVVLDRRDHVDAPYVEQVPLLTALDEIVPQTSFLAQLPRPLHTLITMVLSTGGARRVVYSEASDLPGLVDDILARGASDDHHVVEVGATITGCNCDGRVSPFDLVDSDRPAGSEPVYRRTPFQDAVSIDDALVVLSRNRVTVLDGIGPVLWLAAEDGTEAELTEAALREMPAPPDHIDPAQVVGAALGELVSAGLLAKV